MRNNDISVFLKAIVIFIIILEGVIGLQFLVFQHYAEILFGAKILDPELTRIFGAGPLMISFLFILGLKSESLNVIRLLLKGYIFFTILILASDYYNYVTTAMQPVQTYINAGVLNILVLIVSSVGLMIRNKSDTRS